MHPLDTHAIPMQSLVADILTKPEIRVTSFDPSWRLTGAMNVRAINLVSSTEENIHENKQEISK
jgi:hypothetical protein